VADQGRESDPLAGQPDTGSRLMRARFLPRLADGGLPLFGAAICLAWGAWAFISTQTPSELNQIGDGLERGTVAGLWSNSGLFLSVVAAARENPRCTAAQADCDAEPSPFTAPLRQAVLRFDPERAEAVGLRLSTALTRHLGAACVDNAIAPLVAIEGALGNRPWTISVAADSLESVLEAREVPGILAEAMWALAAGLMLLSAGLLAVSCRPWFAAAFTRKQVKLSHHQKRQSEVVPNRRTI
jgi:hypothetical protein